MEADTTENTDTNDAQSSSVKPKPRVILQDVLAKGGLKTLLQTHPAYAMEDNHRKAYLDEIVCQVSQMLTDVAIQKAYLPVVKSLKIFPLGSSYWERREIQRNHRYVKEGKISGQEAEQAVIVYNKWLRGLYKDEKSEASIISKVPTDRWTTYKRHKAFLFLDASRVLNNAGLNDLDSHVDRLADGLKIPIAVVHEVKTFLTTAGTFEEYRSICTAIDALVNQPTTKKKSVKKSAAAPKKATKKAPQPA